MSLRLVQLGKVSQLPVGKAVGAQHYRQWVTFERHAAEYTNCFEIESPAYSNSSGLTRMLMARITAGRATNPPAQRNYVGKSAIPPDHPPR